ncbi:hypothetical protein EJB05_05875, partial [Eragrostis curvula]
MGWADGQFEELSSFLSQLEVLVENQHGSQNSPRVGALRQGEVDAVAVGVCAEQHRIGFVIP